MEEDLHAFMLPQVAREAFQMLDVDGNEKVNLHVRAAGPPSDSGEGSGRSVLLVHVVLAVLHGSFGSLLSNTKGRWQYLADDISPC